MKNNKTTIILILVGLITFILIGINYFNKDKQVHAQEVQKTLVIQTKFVDYIYEIDSSYEDIIVVSEIYKYPNYDGGTIEYYIYLKDIRKYTMEEKSKIFHNHYTLLSKDYTSYTKPNYTLLQTNFYLNKPFDKETINN